MNATIHLADEFPAATREQWLALVAKTLKGAGVETLDHTTADGLTLHALYDAEAHPRPVTPRLARARPAWDIRAAISHADPAIAHDHLLEALAGGATSARVTLAAGDHPGVRITDSQSFSRLLHGVFTDIAPIGLAAGPLGRTAARWLDAAAKASPAAPLAFHLDPVSAFAATGRCSGPIAAQIRDSAILAARLGETYPRASLFLASGRVAHEAGATAANEIAIAAAAALTYAKALTEAGLAMTPAWDRIVFGLSADAQPIETIAKVRAARQVFGRMIGACGVAAPVLIEAQSSGRMLTRADAWTNLVRLTCAGFAAATGGADAIILATHDDALGTAADATALRLARNSQIILMEEAFIGRVEDPAGGAWALEAHSQDLARAAWKQFMTLEAQGGLIAALQSGRIADETGAARETLARDLADGRRRLLGVTDFAPAEASPAPDLQVAEGLSDAADPAPPGPDSHCPPLRSIRLEDLVAAKGLNS
jgi:methylmalonyl-CoA mutase